MVPRVTDERTTRPAPVPAPQVLLEPPFDQPLFALALRAAFSKSTPRFLSLPSALSPASARRLRQLARPHLQPFDLADRGRYRFAELPITELSPLRAQLRDFAAAVSGLSLSPGSARIFVFARGDYSLRFDDARTRQHARAIEATLDLSPAPGPHGATVYSEGLFTHLPVAQLPGQLTLARRSPESSRCDRYRSAIVGPRAFVLLRAAFPLAES